MQTDPMGMRIDLSQAPPQVKTLKEAQALIEALWLMLCEQARQIEEKGKQIEAAGGRADGQPGHEGRTRELLPEEEVSHTQHLSTNYRSKEDTSLRIPFFY